MPTSKKRGGAKAHRKRVQKRNEELGIARKKFQKAFTDMYETKLKELQEKFESLSASTENEENETVNLSNEELVGTEEKTEGSDSEGKSE
jgi:hypothetical protein